jgi:hypothetical protein
VGPRNQKASQTDKIWWADSHENEWYGPFNNLTEAYQDAKDTDDSINPDDLRFIRGDYVKVRIETRVEEIHIPKEI